MKPATVAEIRRELKGRSQTELVEYCLRLARFKKDNKELLSYLLFDADDEAGYVDAVKYFISDSFDEINKSHIYYAKKGVQKILRQLNKYIRYSGNKQTEVELLIFFLQEIKAKVNYKRNTVLKNIYDRQLRKIEKSLEKLHDDVRGDYKADLKEL